MGFVGKQYSGIEKEWTFHFGEMILTVGSKFFMAFTDKDKIVYAHATVVRISETHIEIMPTPLDSNKMTVHMFTISPCDFLSISDDMDEEMTNEEERAKVRKEGYCYL